MAKTKYEDEVPPEVDERGSHQSRQPSGDRKARE